MKRTSDPPRDIRRDEGEVHVKPYTKTDGTDVSEHSRSSPRVKGKLKFSAPGRMKGKISVFENGRKVAEQKIDRPVELLERRNALVMRGEGE